MPHKSPGHSTVDKAAGPISKDLTEWWQDRQGTGQPASSSHIVLPGSAEGIRVDTDGVTGGWESSAVDGAARPHGR